MTETPKCPYCGTELEVTHAFVSDATAAHKLVYTCFCRECGVYTPKRPTPEEALSAALHRAEPENRPLTREELKAHCAKGRDAEPLWVEFDTVSDMALWVLANTPCGMDEKDIPSLAYWLKDEELVSEYGEFWRCWPRKPTPEQMAAEKWEE